MNAHTLLPWLTDSQSNLPGDQEEMSLAKVVRNDMLSLILKGALAPGQRINEPDIATRLGVSRVPVREALRELESSGLVVARKHSGVFVRQLDLSEIRDLYQLRGLLDGFAGRHAAQLAKAPRAMLLASLNDSVQAMQDAEKQHLVQRYYGENLRFHWLIIAATQNHALTDTYRGLVQKLHLSRLKNLSQDVGMQASIAEHRDIVKALSQGNPQLCEALMSNHVDIAFKRLNIAEDPSQQET
jgi:DNA-binding GntR family transcriptional regulator